MKIFIAVSVLVSVLFGCSPTRQLGNKNAPGDFSFVFMTDIHLQPELGAVTAFKKAIDTANKLKADFVMTGGDLVFDVLRGNKKRADSLFQLYKQTITGFNMPVHHVIGNHELYGIYEGSNIKSDDPDYKYGMFKRYFGDTYYSFDHKGWHFIALNSIDEKDKHYIGIIDEEQKAWLKKDLAALKPGTPVVVTLHIPLVSVQYQVHPPKKPVPPAPNELWVSNRNEILDIFKQYNVKLVLQGHLHWLEDIQVEGKTRFITGGAIAGRPSWKGNANGEEGFLLIKIKNQDVSWQYIDYGWETEFKN